MRETQPPADDLVKWPPYCLNIFNDADVLDDQGQEFVDLSAAKQAAIQGARAMMAEHVATGHSVNLACK